MELNELFTKQFEKQDAMLGEIKSLHESKVTELATENANLKARLDEIETKLNRSAATVTKDNEAERPFKSFGEQLSAIVAAGSNGVIDKRLLALNEKAASGGSALVPSDGGWLIQTEFSSEIFKRTYELSALASRARRVPIGANADGLEIPYVDETSRATGSRWGGVRVYRAAETDPATASKPKIGKLETRLEDLKGLAYMTDRLLRDASAMESIYKQAFAEEFAFKLDDEIFRGSGSGECLGILNAGCLVTQSKESAQTADTVNATNIVKMNSRMPSRNKSNAVWFINNEVTPQLQVMTLGNQPIYMPPGGLTAAPYGTLLGRPVIEIEHASALGDLGDIVFADMSQYLVIEKDGLQASESMHVRFLYDEKAFKWVMRVNGQPLWKSALTPYKGSNTLSPFVILEAR